MKKIGKIAKVVLIIFAALLAISWVNMKYQNYKLEKELTSDAEETFSLSKKESDKSDQTKGKEAEKQTENDKDETTKSTGIRKDFKEAMDSYEKVMNSYADFMTKYNRSDNQAGMISEYADYMKKYADAAEKFEKWNENDLTNEETKYYIDVQARVSKRLSDIPME